MEIDLLIKNICEKESEYQIYNINIKGISLYNFIRQDLRTKYLKLHGIKCMDLVSAIDIRRTLVSAFVSMYHVLNLLFFPICRSNVFIAFSRTDKIGSYYCDKFTDPFIDSSNIGNDYIIFEHGRGGIHHRPRLHNSNIIYSDIITIIARLISLFVSVFWRYKHKKELTSLFSSLYSIYDKEVINEKQIVRSLLYSLLYTKQYKFLLKKIGAKRIFAPVRPVEEFIAARQLSLQCFEMQHGVTYGETVLYSGYSERMITPDFFLAFGDNDPKNVYGIEEDKIFNVGWPLSEYILRVAGTNVCNKKDILVISEPEVSEAIISVVLKLAKENPDNQFYIRPHPHEKYDEDQLHKIHSLPNINIQDNTINISVALQNFQNIIGENSTVLYEALDLHRKVGKLFFEGLHPIYLNSNDKESFWEIYSLADFSDFLEGTNINKKARNIYSRFDKDLFNSLINK